MRSYDAIYLDSTWVPSSGSTKLEIVSPHDEQVIATAPSGTVADIDAAVAAARRAFDSGPSHGAHRTPRVPVPAG
ncbi:aldehyde dehydrogenase family protein [Nocardia sp. NPDC052278]|uniref:aldehyde dehydrogenase family protein n=1 Tax=unclassified Nocardia TaxID=2637762 RepID=UPI0036A60A36